MPFADPTRIHPITLPSGDTHEGTVFLAAAIDHPRIEVGQYTYMSSHQPLIESDDIVARLAPYIYPFSRERIVIGRFCQIAHGVQLITSGANHRYDGLSSFPFAIFDDAPGMMDRPSMPKGSVDTIIGNDVWLGTGAMILPGAQIGDGAIIGAGAVVAGTVAPYTIVAGNPARLVRERLSSEDAARMQQIAWWDWPIEAILAHEALICGTDLDALARVALEFAGPRG